MSTSLKTRSHPRTVADASAAEPTVDDGIKVTELPDEQYDPANFSGVVDHYHRCGFDTGRRRGFREAQALVSLTVEELIRDAGLGDVPPSLLRSVAAAITAGLDRYAPHDGYFDGGLGI